MPNSTPLKPTSTERRKLRLAIRLERERRRSEHPERNYATDPIGYSENILGAGRPAGSPPFWWAKQQEVIRHLHTPPYRVLARASHTVGKTHLTAGAINHFFDSFDPGIVLTTSPKYDQVKDVIWKEIRLQRRGRDDVFPGPKAPRMETAPDHYATGFTAARGAGAQRQHELKVLGVIDEAVGVAPEIWLALDSMCTHMLAICNPTDPGSEFYRREQMGGWHVVTISALEHPNIAAELAGQEPPYPKAIRLNWLRDRIKEWCDLVKGPPQPADFEFDGKWWHPGPLAECRLLGRWPSAAGNVWSESVFLACERATPREFPIAEPPEIGCFVAGTLVDTDAGPVAIEKVKVGDMVLTRQGYKPVKAAFCTGVQPTVTICSKDGRTQTGTQNHPIWNGQGWQPLGSLENHDRVFTCASRSNTTESSGFGSQKQNGRGRRTTFEDTFRGEARSRDGRVIPCTDMPGRTSMDQSPMACVYTTRTTTRRTTTSAILNFSPGQPTAPTTRIIYEFQESANVRSVGIGTPTSPFRRGFAATGAGVRRGENAGWMTSSEHAANAPQCSCAASTSHPRLAPVRVLTKSLGKPEKVYNLTVEGCPEYFANGILVHNCDVARFGDDETVFHVRWGAVSLYHESVNGWSTSQTAGRLKQLAQQWAQFANDNRGRGLRPFRPEEIPCKIDDDGVGGSVTDQGDGYRFVPVSAGRAAYADLRYPNKRSELWFDVRERADMGLLCLARLDAATRLKIRLEALAPSYKLDAAGRRVVEPKADTKGRLTHSPDNMDAVNLAYCSIYGAVARWVEPKVGSDPRTSGERQGLFGRPSSASPQRQRTFGR
jgi:hypothetical protein